MKTQHASLPDADSLFLILRRRLHLLAGKVCRELSLAGPGHGAVELDELVNEGFVAALAALPRHEPARGRLEAFTGQRAFHAMRDYAWAVWSGLSRLEHKRQCGGKGRGRNYPRTAGGLSLDLLADGGPEDARESTGRVEALLDRLPARERRVLRAFLCENGNRAAVRRRLRVSDRRLNKALALARQMAG